MVDINVNELIEKFNKFKGIARKKGPQDLVSVDFDPKGVSCVRMKKAGEDVSVVAADILPAVDIDLDPAQAVEKSETFLLSKPLVARYVSICVPADKAVIKMLPLQGELDSDSEAQIRESIGIDAENFRIGYRIIHPGHGRSDNKLLIVAIPDEQAHAACSMFPSGLPAPMSIELSGLAALTAFLYGPVQDNPEDAVGIIECGARNTFLAFFLKKEMILIRKFDFGTYHLLDTIQQRLGVDRETAQDIISDGSFDISQSIREVSEPFIKQLMISRHFVERRENCHVLKFFVPGEAVVSRDWLNEVRSALDVDVDLWNPFDAMTVLPNALPKEFEGQESRFSAAVGAGLGSFEEIG